MNRISNQIGSHPQSPMLDSEGIPRWLFDMDQTEAARKRIERLFSRVLRSAERMHETSEGCLLEFPATRQLRQALEGLRRRMHFQAPGIPTEVEDHGEELHLRMSISPEMRGIIAQQYRHKSVLARANLHLARGTSKFYRLASAWFRELPDFLIIGAPRCGTTSLYTSLEQHPCIWPAVYLEDVRSRREGKEPHYFDLFPHKSIRYYRAHFPLKLRRRRAQRDGDPFVTGEATPNYLFEPGVAQRVKKVVPSVKIIVMLRNPVDRAYSHYQWAKVVGMEPLAFEAATGQESARLAVIRERDQETATYMRATYSYLSGGFYADHLERWFDAFPREQFLLIRSEDYYRDRKRIIDGMLKFLELDPWPPMTEAEEKSTDAPGEVRNEAPREEMHPETRERMGKFFRPRNERLYSLVGRDFAWE